MVAGLTNGYQSYTATPEEYDACHYEGSFTLFGRQQGPRYLDAALPLVQPLLGGMPAPTGHRAAAHRRGHSRLPVRACHARCRRRGGRARRHGDPRRPRGVQVEGRRPHGGRPRGATFVALQYEQDPGEFRTVATEDGVLDTTAFDDSDDSWTETWQFTECDRARAATASWSPAWPAAPRAPRPRPTR